jgi:hypothetical protein
MSKYYSSHYNCAHAWAHGHSNDGQASNLFFEGTTIYSYGRHFPIAHISEHHVFFTLRSYSASTAKHKSRVHSAISHKRIIYVWDVPTTNYECSSDVWLKRNIDHWLGLINEAAEEFKLFPRRKKLAEVVDKNKEQLLLFINSLQVKIDDSLRALFHDRYLENISAIKKRLDNKILTRAKENFKESLKQWRNHNQKYLTAPIPEILDNNSAFLRYNKATKRIETSKGIQIPVELARRFWVYIQTQLAKKSPECNYQILQFTLDSISDKQIIVGCHTISMNEIKKIAKSLKWTL